MIHGVGTDIVRVARMGDALARHGALRGIERDPNTPPQVRRLVRIARLGTLQPREPDYRVDHRLFDID